MTRTNSHEPTHQLPAINTLERLRSGKWHVPIGPETHAERTRTIALLKELNELANSDPVRARRIVQELTHADHDTATATAPFQVEYGCHLRLGRDVFLNYGVTILSSALVTIGDRSMVGPSCTFATINHPVNDVAMRRAGWERATPITIGEDVWIGSNVTIVPGVTIGDRCVIGAGSVVTRDIPSDSIALGSPARVVRTVPRGDAALDSPNPDPSLERSQLAEEGLPLDPAPLLPPPGNPYDL